MAELLAYGIWIQPKNDVGWWKLLADGSVYSTYVRGVAYAQLREYQRLGLDTEAWVATFGPDGSASAIPPESGPSEHKGDPQ